MDGRKSEKMRHREQICEILGGVDTDRPPLVHGHMMKRNTSRPIFNKRYFALYEGVLIYYHHEKDYKKDRKNGMRNCKELLKLSGVYLTKPESSRTRPKHCFRLHLPDGFNKRREILLVTSDRKSKNIWIEMLQQQNPSLLPPSSPEDLSLKPAYIQRLRSRSVDVSRSRSVDISRSRSVDISQSRNVGADTRHLQQIYIQSSLNTPLSPWSSSPTAPRRPQLKRSHSF